MPDDPTTTGGETPPANDPPPADPPADPPPTGDDFDKDRAMALIAKLRDEVKEAKASAKDRADLKARLDAIEAEQLTEQERVQKERDEAVARAAELERTNRENAVKLAVFAQQQEKGIADADLALAALDRTKIEFDDQGRPTNVDALLDDLLERKPLLKGTPAPPRVPSTDGGAGGGNPPDLTAEELEAAAATGMSPERFAAVKAAMKGRGSVAIGDLTAALTKQG